MLTDDERDRKRNRKVRYIRERKGKRRVKKKRRKKELGDHSKEDPVCFQKDLVEWFGEHVGKHILG